MNNTLAVNFVKVNKRFDTLEKRFEKGFETADKNYNSLVGMLTWMSENPGQSLTGYLSQQNNANKKA